jgi:hypothetical protein
VAIASDNTRDQFYAYGDLDMLEVFNQVCLYFSIAMDFPLSQIQSYNFLEKQSTKTLWKSCAGL